MGSRIALHDEIKAVSGVSQVYYQPPASVRLSYPCVIYNKDSIDTLYANNSPYISVTRYSVTVIDKDPDNALAEKLLRYFPFCRFDRRYTADNLYHDVLTLYY